MKFRMLVDVSYIDLLVDAETEEDAMNQVRAWIMDKNNRPFGAGVRVVEYRVRKPWKKQLTGDQG